MTPDALLRLHADTGSLPAIREWLEDRALGQGLEPSRIPYLVLAVEEAVTNIIRHGYGGADGSLELAAEREGSTLVVRIRDRAPLFNPLNQPDPDLHSPLDARPQGSMGIYLMKKVVDQIRHRPLPGGGNELELIFELS